MNPLKCTEYDNINFLMTTTVTTPQNKLSRSRLTQANYRYGLEKHRRQPGSQAATAFNAVYDHLKSTINDRCDLEKHRRQPGSQAATAFNAVYDHLESTITVLQNRLRQL